MRFEISISLDGYVAGPNRSEEHPLGEGGEELHEWVVKLAAWREAHGREGGEVNASTPLMEDLEPVLVVDTPEVTHVRYRVG